MFISILKVWPFLFYLSCWKEEEKRTQYSWLRSKYTGVSVDPQDMGTYPISKTILVLTHWSETQMSGRQEEVLCVIWMTFQVFFSSFGSWNIKPALCPDTSNAESCSSLLSLSRNATNTHVSVQQTIYHFFFIDNCFSSSSQQISLSYDNVECWIAPRCVLRLEC